jgi:arylsulfatase A-like enzyme
MKYKPLASQFRDSGFATGGFAVNGYVSRDYNYDTGFDTYYSVQEATSKKSSLTQVGKRVDEFLNSDFLRSNVLGPTYRFIRQLSTGDNNTYTPNHTDEDTVTEALSFIKEHQSSDEDFFCWIHFMDAHTPYGYWPEHLRAIRGDPDIEHTIHPGDEGKVIPGEGPEPEVIDTYDAAIRRVDNQIGRVLDVLEDEVTVVITGDHGEEFGRIKDFEFHQASVYGSYTQVPIIVRTPSIEEGEKEVPAQHLDITPTLLTAADIDIPEYYEGEALQTLQRERDSALLFALNSNHMAVRKGKWKLIEFNGERELYELPHMEIESEPTASAPEKRSELENYLQNFRKKELPEFVTTAMKSKENELSSEVEENLVKLGYK